MQRSQPDQKIENIQNIIAKNEKEKRKILVLYTIFFGSFFIAIIPISIASIFAAMICVCTLSIIYAIRSNSEEDSLAENHMTYLIRTFWRANLYLFIMMFFAFTYLTVFADYIPILPCIKYMENNFYFLARQANTQQLLSIFTPCKEEFFKHNQTHLRVSEFIAFSPTLVYLFLRCLKGWILVVQNKLVPDPKL